MTYLQALTFLTHEVKTNIENKKTETLNFYIDLMLSQIKPLTPELKRDLTDLQDKHKLFVANKTSDVKRAYLQSAYVNLFSRLSSLNSQNLHDLMELKL